jgi:hypothetical protein
MSEDYLKKKWSGVFEVGDETTDRALFRALESASQIGVGFVVIKKERQGYFITQKLWHEVKDELEKIGCIGPFGGRPE